MNDILTVTVNSTLDITARADRVEVDTEIRCTSTTRDPGGGGDQRRPSNRPFRR